MAFPNGVPFQLIDVQAFDHVDRASQLGLVFDDE